MSKIEKIISNMKNNPKGWSFDDIKRVYEYYGCTVRNRSTGSHYSVTHPCINKTNILPKHNPVKPPYVREMLRYVGTLKEIEGQNDD